MPPDKMLATIRECRLPEDIFPLTELLHRAYAELAERGLRYLATHQTPEVTEERVRAGQCFVAEMDGFLVGTITVAGAKPDSGVPTYQKPGTFILGQFGVDPAAGGRGIGRALHKRAIRFALANGGSIVALDTAAPAEHLITMYSRWGYREVERHRWSVTNYESVIMKMELQRG